MKRYVDADEALGRMLRNTTPNGDCLDWQGQYIEWDELTRRGMLDKRRGRWDNFSENDIRHIRETNVPGRGGNTRVLAEQHGVSMSTIRYIATGRGWGGVK